MRTPWTAVVGKPVKDSLSPEVFRLFASELGRPLRYRALEIAAGDFKPALARARSLPWLGWNVTAPHKVAAAGLVDRLDPWAAAVRAVNVIHFQDGVAMGYNTDVEGFLAPLKRRGVGLRGRTALVLGGGGAAAAVCEALKRSQIAELFVACRTPAHAAVLADRFGGVAVAPEPGDFGRADLVVNATSAGETRLLPEGVRLKPGSWAYDLTYRPSRTRFLAEAEASGARALGGLEMLVRQASLTWRVWFEEELPERAVELVLKELRSVS
ncbi:MAG: shikimate dehydrogenase [Elusimicrobia bacterium]|nr:shikimate dehydrogenase [Elusimicrobiota bacterium]